MAQVEIIAANLKTTEKYIKKILKKTCAYARVSTDSEERLTSYSSQIEHYSEYIKSNPEWEFVGNVKCFGYDWIKETKELKINEKQAEVVRQIFNWYISGIGSYTIAKKLNEEINKYECLILIINYLHLILINS